MLILGFSYFRGAHNTSAALVADGRLVAAAEEERFTRTKYDGSVAVNAIEYCLHEAGVEFRDVDLIAFADTPFRSGFDSAHAHSDLALLERLHAGGLVSRKTLWHKRGLDSWMRLGLPRFNVSMSAEARSAFAIVRERFGPLPPIQYVDHHEAHAAAVFFTSGLDTAAIATIDGRGGNHATVIWRGTGTKLERLHAEPYSNSLGFFYDSCTEYLGFGELHAGKTMGLAPYGDPSALAPNVARLLSNDGPALYDYRTSPNADALGFPPRLGEPALDPPFPNFAAAVQTALETSVRRVVNAATKLTKESALCLGGGVAYNCTSNGSLLANGAAAPIWVFPASGDAGLSIGAALKCGVERGEHDNGRLASAYWGPSFSTASVERSFAEEPRVTFERSQSVAAEAARLIAGGLVIGWFQGRMELGPRALGNRSILADPRSTEIRDRVNDIKRRERWRPLAPAVLRERASDYFELRQPSEFMLFAAQVGPEKRASVRGIVHVDGSARPQTVDRNHNPRFYDLIAEFDRLTGIPLILNTSFNNADEPIVCTPSDAIRTFLRTDLDALIIEDFLVRKAG